MVHEMVHDMVHDADTEFIWGGVGTQIDVEKPFSWNKPIWQFEAGVGVVKGWSYSCGLMTVRVKSTFTNSIRAAPLECQPLSVL
jgi:hypothetical protein